MTNIMQKTSEYLGIIRFHNTKNNCLIFLILCVKFELGLLKILPYIFTIQSKRLSVKYQMISNVISRGYQHNK